VSDAKIARVYGGALYAAAVEAGRVDTVRRDLTAFTEAVRSSSALHSAWVDEDVPEEKKRRMLLELTSGGEPLVRNYLRLLVDKGRETALEGSNTAFAELVDENAGVIEVEVITARPLPEELAAEIRQSLEASLQKTVHLKLGVDEELIGGMKLRIGDKIADASLRHRLERLRDRLASPMARLEGSVEAAS
jgi:F-type H+-transporting ATPase subunit delta